MYENRNAHIFARPLIPLLISMIFGIALGSWFSGHGAWVYPVIFLCACITFYAIKERKTFFILPLVLFLALGYLSIQPWVAPKFPSNHIINFVNTHPWKIVGIIDNNPSKYKNRVKFILRSESLGKNDNSFTVTGKIRVTVSGNSPDLSMGDRILFDSKIRSIRNFNNPGGFDYKKYMAFKGVWGSAYAKGERLPILNKNSEKGLSSIIEDARNTISDLIEKTGSREQNGVLKALIVGDNNSIPQYLREAFNRAGIGHLLAISGLHIGIVATAAFILFSWMLSHYKPFLWNAWTRKGAAVLSLMPVLIYGLLAGMSPSTQRAVIMVAVYLMTFLFEREHDPINTMAVAAMLILVIHPPSLFSVSFQLSFSAVFAIIYGLSKIKILNNPKVGLKFKSLQKILTFLYVSLLAILGTLPFVMFYFNLVSLVGLFANCIAVPLIGFIVVPLGLFSVFLYPLSIQAALSGIKASAVVMDNTLEIVKSISDLPFAAVKTVTPTYFEISCYYILLWALLNIRKKPAARIIAVIVLLAVGVDACYWLNNRFWHDDLRVTVIDVGQGSAALLELPEGYRALIDGGGFSDNSAFDIGAKIIAPLLWRKKIKTVDTLILSHPDCDHLNGLLYIAENFNVIDVWSNNEPADTVGYHRFLEIIEKEKIHMPAFKDISCNHEINGVKLKILYPPCDFIDKRRKDKLRNSNNNSLVIKIEFGPKSILFPGDIMSRAEEELATIAGDDLRSTVLLVPHHGSRSSSTPLFLKNINPEFAIISSGWKNRFNFPHPSVIKRYKDQGCRIYRTDTHGALTISTDGQSLTIKPTIIDGKT